MKRKIGLLIEDIVSPIIILGLVAVAIPVHYFQEYILTSPSERKRRRDRALDLQQKMQSRYCLELLLNNLNVIDLDEDDDY
jgi:hypothetical protein